MQPIEENIPKLRTPEYWKWYNKMQEEKISYLKIAKNDNINGCGIYIIRWLNNKFYYIGKSINMRARISRHLTLFSHNYHESMKLCQIYKEFGLPSFAVLEYCEPTNLSNIEEQYLELFINDPYCLNTHKYNTMLFSNEIINNAKQ